MAESRGKIVPQGNATAKQRGSLGEKEEKKLDAGK